MTITRYPRAIAALVLFSCAAAAFSAPSFSLPSAAAICAPYYAELAAQGKVLKTSDGTAPSLIPGGPRAEALRLAIAADKPGILVESAFFLPRTAPADEAGARAEAARIYGLTRSFSALQGIEYFSVSHNAMRTLFAESYRIDGPDTKRRLPDPPAPSPGAVPSTESIFAFQRDLSFGANTYRYDYTAYPESIFVDTRNLTRMSYGIVPMIAPEALRTRLLVIPTTEGIVYYAESDTSAGGPLRGRIGESFANRAEALFKWFSASFAAQGGAKAP
jgi:hypothetical protein